VPKANEPPKEREFSDDEEYVFRQLSEQKPSEAFKVMFKEVTGTDVSEFKNNQEAFREFQKTQKGLTVQQEFVNTHPDYVSTPGSPEALENGTKMRDWVRDHNYPEFTPDNLEKAYQDLKSKGFLNLREVEASGTTEDKSKTNQRIVDTSAQSTQSRSSKKSSSVSTRGAAPVNKTEPSEDELETMPLEKLKVLANKQLLERAQQQQ
jgi:hypothetical protein